MTRFHSSRACHWVDPRPHQDPSLRYMKHGKVLPMHDERGLLARIFGLRRG